MNLELKNAAGEVYSRNLYWLGAHNSSYRRLNHLSAASLSATAKSARADDMIRIHVELRNTGSVVALENKLTLLDAGGSRILPVYYSDNYVSLLPGETRDIDVEYPLKSATGAAQLSLRGWNISNQTIDVK